MPTRGKQRRTLQQLERFAGMRASSKLPSEQRPMRITASGLRPARLAAGMSVAELAAASNCDPGLIAMIEAGRRGHMLSISWASSGLPAPFNNLAEIRDE
jgi:ribosome-binding protein aMBF1 (putative translation factor)